MKRELFHYQTSWTAQSQRKLQLEALQKHLQERIVKWLIFIRRCKKPRVRGVAVVLFQSVRHQERVTQVMYLRKYSRKLQRMSGTKRGRAKPVLIIVLMLKGSLPVVLEVNFQVVLNLTTLQTRLWMQLYHHI